MLENSEAMATSDRETLGATAVVAEPGKPTIVMTRIFDAPRRLVFEVMTKPEHIARWWGPRGSTLSVCAVDVQPGGAYRFVSRGPDGKEYPFKGVYREVVHPERLVFTQRFDVEPYSKYESVVTVALREQGDETSVTLTQVFDSVQSRDQTLAQGAVKGAKESWERLAELLGSDAVGPVARSTKPALLVSRTFDAPRRLVFEAWTKAEHLSKWFSPRPLTTSRCELDFRPGGVFRLVMRAPDGTEFTFDGKFGEIVVPERIVFSGKIHDDNETHTIVTFAENGEKTTLTALQTYSFVSDATRGAPIGWGLTLDQLGEHVARS
jgi:uncharacterized protein YndB with AHSA1/START domain